MQKALRKLNRHLEEPV